MKRYWITGWQCSASAFQSVWSVLDNDENAFLDYAGFKGSLEDWLASTIEELDEECVIVGWSLGGMLACELAKRTSKIKSVYVLNANVQFAGGFGLDEVVAADFMARYQRNPSVTRKRFSSLVDSVNSSDVREFLLEGDRLHSLHWLYEIKINYIPQSLKVYVLLAEGDLLVPVGSAEQGWNALGATVTRIQGEHSLPIFESRHVVQWMQMNG
jgi:pimeloyl-ACP methyl ester carboxylesterase